MRSAERLPPPENSSSSSPPRPSRTVENTSLSAIECFSESTGPGSSAVAYARPTSMAHSKMRSFTGDSDACSRIVAKIFS